MLTNQPENLIKGIQNCRACSLHVNQNPLVSSQVKTSNVIWLWLSAVRIKDDIIEPLWLNTPTGKFLKWVEDKLPGTISFYRTNIVKCLPLNAEGKIRYPQLEEMSYCSKQHLKNELDIVKAQVIVLLGKQVESFFLKNIDTLWINQEETFILIISHPSYYMIYKRKNIDVLQTSIANMIKEKLGL